MPYAKGRAGIYFRAALLGLLTRVLRELALSRRVRLMGGPRPIFVLTANLNHE
jgi:hypothetical protein